VSRLSERTSAASSRFDYFFGRIGLTGDGAVLVVFCLAAVALGSVPRFLGYASGATSFKKLFEFNAGEFLTLFAVFSLAKSPRDAISLSGRDLVVLVACSLFFLPPEPQNIPFLGVTIAGLYFNWRQPNRALRSIGQVWVALSVCEAWSGVFFKLVATPVLSIEAFLVVKVGQLLGFGLSLDGVLIRSPNDWDLYLLEACSSFHNLCLAFLVWFSLLKISNARTDIDKFLALLLSAVTIVVLNTIRVLLMTRSEDMYLFWHQGNGQIVYSTLALAAAALPTLALIRRETA
jgi:exosortase/archaeosortase family protein